MNFASYPSTQPLYLTNRLGTHLQSSQHWIGSIKHNPVSEKLAQYKIITTGLSNDGVALLSQRGIRPVGQCAGIAAGVLSKPWTDSLQESKELPQWGEGKNWIVQLAMDRLKEDAKMVGANGVIAVTVEMEQNKRRELEVIAKGSAVHLPALRGETAFLSSLEAEYLCMLLDMGFIPLDVKYICSAYHVRTGVINSQAWFKTVEQKAFSEVFSKAREQLQGNIQKFCMDLGGNGVIRLSLGENRLWNNHVLEFYAQGDIVANIVNSSDQKDKDLPKLFMPLNR